LHLVESTTYNTLYIYWLYGMMTGLQDIHWAKHRVAEPSVCSEDPSSCHLTDLNHGMTLQFHDCIAWES